jgi:hypothetical protein
MSTINDEHKNDKKVWKLHDGFCVSTFALKRMFMGKLPNPAQRMLLGIVRIA